ncbi:MAG: ribosomal protein S18-alanine N-acetyltransferase [Pseudomonadota bacterium]
MRWPFSRTAQEALAVEPFTASHLRYAADIHAATFFRPWTDGEIENLLNTRTNWAFVARHRDRHDRVAGFAILRSAFDEAEVLTIAVKPSWQGYGVGQMLMDAALSRAYSERISSVFLEVDENNKGALRLYTKLGFIPVGERPDYYRQDHGRRSRAIIMRRDLEVSH